MVLAVFVVMFFSLLAFWRFNAVLFMLVAGASLMTGLYWYDIFTNELGLGIAMMLIAYSLICMGFGFGCLFRRGKPLKSREY